MGILVALGIITAIAVFYFVVTWVMICFMRGSKPRSALENPKDRENYEDCN